MIWRRERNTGLPPYANSPVLGPAVSMMLRGRGANRVKFGAMRANFFAIYNAGQTL